jgi:hypothetical protein
MFSFQAIGNDPGLDEGEVAAAGSYPYRFDDMTPFISRPGYIARPYPVSR